MEDRTNTKDAVSWISILSLEYHAWYFAEFGLGTKTGIDIRSESI